MISRSFGLVHRLVPVTYIVMLPQVHIVQCHGTLQQLNVGKFIDKVVFGSFWCLIVLSFISSRLI
jgi:hypothetical protein